jgi:hypothetical protein
MPRISHRVNDLDRESDNDSDIDDISILSARDKQISGYRDVENVSKFNIILGMIKTRQNVKNNKDLMPIYFRSKQLFDEIVEEQNKQVTYLQNIIRHLDSILHDHLSPSEGQITTSKKYKKTTNARTGKDDKSQDHMIQDIIKEKQKVGKLLMKMRMVLNKLNEIDTLTHITPERMAAFSPGDFNTQVGEDDNVDDDDIILMLNDPNEQFYSSSDEGDDDDDGSEDNGSDDEDN